MKRLLSLFVASILAFATPASAAIQQIAFSGLKVTSPDTPASVVAIPGVCDEQSIVIDNNTPASPVFYHMRDCASTPAAVQYYPVPEANVVNLAADLAGKLNVPAGTSAQYLDGTGAVKSFSSRTFNYPARSLSSCFQVSSTQDADVNYSVDINAALTLGGGTGVLTSYTNSGCSTGSQVVANGAVSSVALGGTSSIPLHGVVPAGKWLKVTGTASGGGTAAIDGVQAETLLP